MYSLYLWSVVYKIWCRDTSDIFCRCDLFKFCEELLQQWSRRLHCVQFGEHWNRASNNSRENQDAEDQRQKQVLLSSFTNQVPLLIFIISHIYEISGNSPSTQTFFFKGLKSSMGIEVLLERYGRLIGSNFLPSYIHVIYKFWNLSP